MTLFVPYKLRVLKIEKKKWNYKQVQPLRWDLVMKVKKMLIVEILFITAHIGT